MNDLAAKVGQLSMKETITETKPALPAMSAADVLKKNTRTPSNPDKLAADIAALSLASKPTESPYRYFICIDFEATCDGEIVLRDGKKSFRSSRTKGQYWQNEILSFPCVIVDLKARTVCDEFHSFIQPVINPILTEYCQQLTGVAQWQVDEAPIFPEGLLKFEEYFGSQLTRDNTLLVSDSSYDFTGFFRKQCLMSGIAYPDWARKWVNLKRLFVEFYGMQANEKQLPSLRNMVEMAGLKFDGKLHSGMDDVNNMAKLLLRMASDGLSGIKPNEALALELGPPYYHVIEGKKIDKEASRLARLVTGGADQNSFAAKAKHSSPQKDAKPKRKVALVTKSTKPVTPQAAFGVAERNKEPTFAEKVAAKLEKLPNFEKKVVAKEVEKTPLLATPVGDALKLKNVTPEPESKDEKALRVPENSREKGSARLEVSKFKSMVAVGPLVRRGRADMLKIGVSVLVDNEADQFTTILEATKKRLAGFVAEKEALKDDTPMPDFFIAKGLSLQDLATVVKMATGWLPRTQVMRSKPPATARTQPGSEQRRSEYQKNSGTIGNQKRRSHGGGAVDPKADQAGKDATDENSKPGNNRYKGANRNGKHRNNNKRNQKRRSQAGEKNSGVSAAGDSSFAENTSAVQEEKSSGVLKEIATTT